jgi:hypothetical protein
MDAQILIAGVVIAAVTFVHGLRAGLAAIIVVWCIFYILGRPI